MRDRPRKKLHERLRERIRRVFRKPEADPDDPYALVGAPKKPRPPVRSSAVAVEPDRSPDLK